jgi:hypothetical protein
MKDMMNITARIVFLGYIQSVLIQIATFAQAGQIKQVCLA